ncbi:polysaccharide pyruvyl transferase family protein [Cohnella ginsengisoli]|uniref:Polysaccharide pyruvyl transferase family protein n=1 Tax=Cohnella ginsengisoli TaxID=425004 RepID=A0A9X4QMC5_9BACL|nr:polysaccharide pyruvyl transferase family protein [Cohnella ginsengisoli]MDG0791779.1 polysaccharide pyruvyl transferase family protein [Cohnella ginsengisoli]
MKVLMFAHGGSLNRGCEAIVRSSTAIIKEKLTESKVYLASGRPDTDRVITQLDHIYDGADRKIKPYTPSWLLSALRIKLLKDESYALGKIHRNIIDRIRDVDICLSIGGDNYCYGEQPGWYEVDRRVKAQGKKLVLWGCSIGEEDMSERKLEDLKQFDLILARETLTYEMLTGKGLRNVKLIADPAFTMAKEELPLPDGWQEGNTVGLNFSPLVWSRNKASREAVRELIQHIIQTSDMTIALTPHVMETGNNDYEVLKNYYEEFKHTGRLVLLPDNLTAVQYKGYIARMRFFIGARTHATIAAYSNCVPTMVLGYSVKSKGIAKDIFGEEKLVLGIQEIAEGSKLKSKYDEMVAEESELRRKLSESIPRVQRMSYLAVNYLSELV